MHGQNAGPDPRERLRELAVVFLRLGSIGFGGPAAHVGLMREEVVRRRGWVTEQEFLDLLGAVSLIPGPNSTELAMHVGLHRAGWAGLVVAGLCFIVPAALIVTVLAWLYVTYRSLPQAESILYGIKPAIIAIVIRAIYSLMRQAVRTRTLAAVALVCVVLSAWGVHELGVLLGAGVLMMGVTHAWRVRRSAAGVVPLALLQASMATVEAPFGLWPLFLFFAKVGSVLFGSGYVLIAFLRADLVERWKWLTEQQLLDCIAIGQMIPGPIFTTATFIGYVLGGGPGAVVATIGIFLPAFLFVAASGPLIPRLRGSPTARAFLDGVNVASLALMSVVTWQLARAAVVDAVTTVIAIASAVALLRLRLNSVWLVAGGAVVGLLAWLTRAV